MQFKLTSLLLLLPLSLALPEPIAEPVTEAGFKEGSAITARDGPDTLIARACSYTTGCTSQSGASAGKYCGFCTQLLESMVVLGPRAAAVMEQARHVLHVGQLSAQMFLSNAPTMAEDTSWVEAVD
ncbi:hypothetical protein EAF00_003325 [Botryotinia globosa]|nr:hypothetical protein EAF00_003325 [Botryotinia globosa]